MAAATAAVVGAVPPAAADALAALQHVIYLLDVPPMVHLAELAASVMVPALRAAGVQGLREGGTLARAAAQPHPFAATEITAPDAAAAATAATAGAAGAMAMAGLQRGQEEVRKGQEGQEGRGGGVWDLQLPPPGVQGEVCQWVLYVHWAAAVATAEAVLAAVAYGDGECGGECGGERGGGGAAVAAAAAAAAGGGGSSATAPAAPATADGCGDQAADSLPKQDSNEGVGYSPGAGGLLNTWARIPAAAWSAAAAAAAAAVAEAATMAEAAEAAEGAADKATNSGSASGDAAANCAGGGGGVGGGGAGRRLNGSVVAAAYTAAARAAAAAAAPAFLYGRLVTAATDDDDDDGGNDATDAAADAAADADADADAADPAAATARCAETHAQSLLTRALQAWGGFVRSMRDQPALGPRGLSMERTLMSIEATQARHTVAALAARLHAVAAAEQLPRVLLGAPGLAAAAEEVVEGREEREGEPAALVLRSWEWPSRTAREALARALLQADCAQVGAGRDCVGEVWGRKRE